MPKTRVTCCRDLVVELVLLNLTAFPLGLRGPTFRSLTDVGLLVYFLPPTGWSLNDPSLVYHAFVFEDVPSFLYLECVSPLQLISTRSHTTLNN